ncbi:MAG: hypothetical protein EOO61_00825 [Hymenobacter sp.]|nr:MAG: hypothetical protein EOO61_00825 [Hymenobacter sp.]
MEPTDEILLGRRHLEGIFGYKLLEDLHWNTKVKKWTLRFELHLASLHIGDEVKNIPERTSWYALFDTSYPWGAISIHPDQQGGIVDTFQHQNCNQVSSDFKWRTGDLCVKTSLRSFARRGYDIEPYDATRLAWHIERCKMWLELASLGQLSTSGDPFELPHYPIKTNATVVFLENNSSWNTWQAFPEEAGLVTFRILKANPQVLVINEFQSLPKKTTIEVEWGHYLTDSHFLKEAIGIWVRLKSLPVLTPWKAPLTWEEVYEAAAGQGIDLAALVKDSYRKSWKLQPTFLLLGFPIPAKVGDSPQQMHWLAVQFDRLASDKGFRKKSAELLKWTQSQLFSHKKPLKWAATENWASEEITARGRISPSISLQRLLIIGVGAVGSALAELMARMGCYQLSVLDSEVVEIGNMSRHTLTIDSLKTSKAEAVSNRLNRVSPNNTIHFIKQTLEQSLQFNTEFLVAYDIVIDATGSDQVLYELSRARKNAHCKFVSLSLGLYAHRLFCFTTILSKAIEEDFHKRIAGWLVKEQEEYKGHEHPREGLGCWHPLFPARADDVWMMTSSAVKLIEQRLLSTCETPNLIVLEQSFSRDQFVGLVVITENQ